jgi:hypothetical protein
MNATMACPAKRPSTREGARKSFQKRCGVSQEKVWQMGSYEERQMMIARREIDRGYKAFCKRRGLDPHDINWRS